MLFSTDSGDMHAPLSYYVYCSLYAWAVCLLPSPNALFMCSFKFDEWLCLQCNSFERPTKNEKFQSKNQCRCSGVNLHKQPGCNSGPLEGLKIQGGGKYNVVGIICSHPLVEIGLTDLTKSAPPPPLRQPWTPVFPLWNSSHQSYRVVQIGCK